MARFFMAKFFFLTLVLTATLVAAEDATKGYLDGAKQVADNIWIGPQPSAADFNELAAEEVTVVVNTRTAAEMDQLDFAADAQAQKFNMNYELIEIGQGHAYSPVQLAQFNDFMQAHEGQKMLLHCRSGNRASQLYAAWLIKHQNKTATEALQAIQSEETELNDAIKALLGE
ncbi:fused DSP-PTPase phosphatase/NAD kinase-like protein [Marinicella meishanensis]|uniref:fused DSP-PTPase phosphatase/NAD kinase-like protein n=1 Tax=Marinicella meishanensis TaxID=2873263 RepID=UPI001CBD0119|nr:sulfur transferase domain-containing protein [Marinicella sp. NBU2979]